MWHLGQIVRGSDDKPYMYLGMGPFSEPPYAEFLTQEGEVRRVEGGVPKWYHHPTKDGDTMREGSFTEWRNEKGGVLTGKTPIPTGGFFGLIDTEKLPENIEIEIPEGAVY